MPSHTLSAWPGMDSLDAAQGAQRAEDSGERQRQFMEQLQRKVQDRKLRAEASSKPCLAALLASAARKVRPPPSVCLCMCFSVYLCALREHDRRWSRISRPYLCTIAVTRNRWEDQVWTAQEHASLSYNAAPH